MVRNKMKESEARTFRIRKNICKRIDEYSESSMISKTAIVEKAIEEYLNKVNPVKNDSKNNK